MIMYLSGMDKYTLRFIAGGGSDERKDSLSTREAVQKTATLFSYHYLYPGRMMSLQFNAWESILHGRPVGLTDSLPFLNKKEKKTRKKAKKNESKPNEIVKSPRLNF